jgi:hypothetical protein
MTRRDDLVALLRDAREVLSQIDQGGNGGKVFARDDCIVRLRASVANLDMPAAFAEAMQDALTHGIGATQGGKRIDPRDYYVEPQEPAPMTQEDRT